MFVQLFGLKSQIFSHSKATFKVKTLRMSVGFGYSLSASNKYRVGA